MSKANTISFLDVKDSSGFVEDRDKIQKLRDQVSLINKGFIVYVSDVSKSIDKDNYLLIKVTLLSNVAGMQVFGEEVQLKFAKQTLEKLKSEINKATQ